MEQRFDELKQGKLTYDIGEELFDLWVSNNRPQPPSGPSTNYHMSVAYCEAEEPEITKELADSYNQAIDNLFYAVDIRNVGEYTWYTTWEQGTEDWQNYRTAALEIIYEVISDILWDRACVALEG